MDLNTGDGVRADDVEQARGRIAQAYDPARFLQDGEVVLSELAAFLKRSQASEGRVLNWRAPQENILAASSLLDQDVDLRTLLQTTLSRGQTLHDPRYIGHQVSAPVPVAALMEAVSGLINQGMTIYEMGPWSSAVERVMITRLGQQLGLSSGFGGILTSGGSLANLTALLTARNVANQRFWKQGGRAAGEDSVILTSPESHYCIERAAGILGLGVDNCLRVAIDEAGRMAPVKLARQIDGLQGEGRRVIAVVASACTTRTGVYDPLRDIAKVCQKFDVWMHVDAAHGGAAAFSPRYVHLLDGIGEADSVVWDAHKMMFTPALSTYLFYKRSNDQYKSANQEASYLFDDNANRVEAYNTGLGTIECTKRAAALSLWTVWALHGPTLFMDLIDATYGTARLIAERMRQHPDFELLNEPQSNILVFRFIPAALRQAPVQMIGEFQQAVRQKLVESGQAYIVPAMDKGVGALRMVVMNPLTSERHFECLATSLQTFGEEILNK